MLPHSASSDPDYHYDNASNTAETTKRQQPSATSNSQIPNNPFHALNPNFSHHYHHHHQQSPYGDDELGSHTATIGGHHASPHHHHHHHEVRQPPTDALQFLLGSDEDDNSLVQQQYDEYHLYDNNRNQYHPDEEEYESPETQASMRSRHQQQQQSANHHVSPSEVSISGSNGTRRHASASLNHYRNHVPTFSSAAAAADEIHILAPESLIDRDIDAILGEMDTEDDDEMHSQYSPSSYRSNDMVPHEEFESLHRDDEVDALLADDEDAHVTANSTHSSLSSGNHGMGKRNRSVAVHGSKRKRNQPAQRPKKSTRRTMRDVSPPLDHTQVIADAHGASVLLDLSEGGDTESQLSSSSYSSSDSRSNYSQNSPAVKLSPSQDAISIIDADDHLDALLRDDTAAHHDESQKLQKNILTPQHEASQTPPSSNTIASSLEVDSVSIMNHALELEREALSLVRVKRLAELSKDLVRRWSQVGKPTALRNTADHVAVGTTRGFILIYTQRKAPFALCVPASSDGHNNSGRRSEVAVTSLDIMENHLAAGYEDGRVILWDLSSRAIVKTISDQLVGAINFVLFVREKHKIFACNQRTAIIFNINKALFRQSVMSTVVTDGKYGHIRHVSLLPTPKAYNAVNDYLVLAMATHEGIVVVTLRPPGKVPILHKTKDEFVSNDPQSKDDVNTFLPYLDWWGVTPSSHDIHNETDTVKKGRDPILGVAWGKTVRFYQMVSMDNHLNMIKLSELQTSREICSLKWIDERVVLLLDAESQISVLDPFTRQIVPNCGNIGDLGWAYHSRFDHPATVSTLGANGVSSQRQYLAKCRAFHHTVDVYRSSLFLLGSQGIDSVRIISWKERIDSLMELEGKYALGFDLGMKIFRNQSEAVGIVGLPRDFVKAQSLVSDHLQQHLRTYLEEKVEKAFGEADSSELSTPQLDPNSSEYRKRMERRGLLCNEAMFCINIALGLERIDLVFSDIYMTFKRMKEDRIFFKVLEEFILKGHIKQIPKVILDVIMKTYVENNDNETLARIIQNIDIQSIEFSTLTKHCRDHHMYDTLIYVYTSRERYVDPVQVLFNIAREQKKISKERYQHIVSLIFKYLSHLFRGQAYPKGSIPQKQLKELKLSLLFEMLSVDSSSGAPLFSQLCSASPPSFASLMIQIFSDQSPTSPWCSDGASLSEDAEHGHEVYHASSQVVSEQVHVTFETILEQIQSSCLEQASVINFMLHNLVDFEKDNPTAPWTVINPKEQTYFFIILNYLASKRLISLDDQTLFRMIVMIAYDTDFEQQEKVELQEQIVATLKQYHPDDKMLRQIIQTCETSRFFIVCVYIYTQKSEYSHILECYLKDEHLQKSVFDAIGRMLKSTKRDSNMHQLLKKAVMDHLSSLIELNCSKTAQLVIDYFYEEHEKVVSLLADYPEMQFEYLRTILGANSYIIENLLKKKGIVIPDALRQKYLELMCRFQPDSVYNHLYNSSFQYPFEQSIALCKRYEILDAAAFLLERAGDIQGAIRLLLDDVEKHLNEFEEKLTPKAKLIDPKNTKFYNVDTFYNARTTKNSLRRITGGKHRRRHSKHHHREHLPKVDSKYVLETAEARHIFSLLTRLLDVLSQACSTDASLEVRHQWYKVTEFFLDAICRLQASFEGRKFVKSKPKEKQSNHNLQVSFDSDTDSGSDGESDEDDPKLLKDTLLTRKKRLEIQINNEMDPAQMAKLRKQHEAIISEIRKLTQMEMTRASTRANNNDHESVHERTPRAQQPKLVILWMQKCFGKCFRMILERVIDFVPVESLLSFLLESYSQQEFGHIRKALMDALENLGYSLLLHKAIIGLTEEDMYNYGTQLVKIRTQGIRSSHYCAMCNQPLNRAPAIPLDAQQRVQTTGAILFPCGHSFHAVCLTNKVKTPRCIICAMKPTNSLSKTRDEDYEGPASQQLEHELKNVEQEEKYLLLRERQQLREAERACEVPVVRSMFLNPDKIVYGTDLMGQPVDLDSRGYRLSREPFSIPGGKVIVHTKEGVNIMAASGGTRSRPHLSQNQKHVRVSAAEQSDSDLSESDELENDTVSDEEVLSDSSSADEEKDDDDTASLSLSDGSAQD